jgi:hypothetical protein
MTESSVKSSIRNFITNPKSTKERFLDAIDFSNFATQLSSVGKMLDESILKFTKRYLIIQTELEEMKREFIGDISLINDYINISKKGKNDNLKNGKYYMKINNIPKLPNYCQKNSLKTDRKILNKSLYLNYNKPLFSNNSSTNISSKSNPRNKRKNLEKKIHNFFKSYSPYHNTQKSKNENLNNSNNFSNCSSIKRKNSKSSISSNNKYIKNKPDIINTFPDNKTKAIYLLLNSPILSYEEKLKLLPSKKIICSNISVNDILNNSLSIIQNKINLLKQKTIEEDEKLIIEKICNYPSKTAKTGLNFLNNEKEKELMINNEQNKKLLEMTSICLGEKIKINKNIKEIYNILFKKYKVNSIKELYFNYIYKKIYKDSINEKLEQKEIKKILTCLENNKSLISDVLTNNNNINFSYIAFSLDEIYEYLCGIKEMDEDLKEKVRNQLELNLLIEDAEKIRNLIK